LVEVKARDTRGHEVPEALARTPHGHPIEVFVRPVRELLSVLDDLRDDLPTCFCVRPQLRLDERERAFRRDVEAIDAPTLYADLTPDGDQWTSVSTHLACWQDGWVGVNQGL